MLEPDRPVTPPFYSRVQSPRIFYGWAIVAVGFLAHLVCAFHMSSTLSVFLKPLTEDLHVSRGLFSLLRSGEIIIRGYTDARPFRSETYDNWRLSTARAHMAYYMLTRGGLPESRVLKIEGFADRHLRNPDDPNAAENRRIEIVLKEVVA